MSAAQQPGKPAVPSSAGVLLEEMKLSAEVQNKQAARKVINSELWHACAGPLVSLPQPGSLVYYFPQGYNEQVAASTRKTVNSHIPNYPNLPSQLLCQVHNVTLHADRETDEIYAQMTLQPVNSEMDVFPIPDFGHTRSKQPSEFFCKNLTASDTSTHGGFSVPRRAAEKLFPQLDYSMQPPNQELVVRDLHDCLWTFRHIYRGQPKRHLLTTGWSSFVGAKRLKAGDAVLFIRDEKSQLLLGVRRASQQQTAMPSSVLSADSMHIGVLAAAAHAAASRSPFTVYYNPRACPSDFIIPLAKYYKAVYTQLSIGMRFGMMFETEESNKRRYMGTVVGIGDYDPLRWSNSRWRNLQVEWDEHGYGERPNRVSVWEIETPESPFVFPPANSSLNRRFLPSFVVPGVQIGFGNSKPSFQTAGSGNVMLNSMLSGQDSEQILKMLFQPQSSHLNGCLGNQQSSFATIIQNIRGSDIPTTIPCPMPMISTTGTRVQNEATDVRTATEQTNHLTLLQQQMLPLQNILKQIEKPLHCIEKQRADLDIVSSTQMEPLEPSMQKSFFEQQFRVQNEGVEHSVCQLRNSSKTSTTNSVKSGTPSAEVINEVNENSQDMQRAPTQQLHSGHEDHLPGKQDGENSVGQPNQQTIVANSIPNKGMEMEGQGDPFLLQQLETSDAQPSTIETPDKSDRNKPDTLSSQWFYSSQCLEHEDWIFHSSSDHSFTGPLKASEFLASCVKPDSLLSSSSETTTSLSGDISTIIHPENFASLDMYQFSHNSDPRNPKCFLSFMQEFFSSQELNPSNTNQVSPGILPYEMHELAVQEEAMDLKGIPNLSGMGDLSNECYLRNEACKNLDFISTVAGSNISNTVLESFGALNSSSMQVPSDSLVGNWSSNHDLQSQVTSTSLGDSQVYSLQDIPDISGGTSSGSMDISEHSCLNRGTRKQVSPQHLRTYTKVQKLGSVGRSIDVTRFRDYQELKTAIASMFGLECQLDDPISSEWKLVYVDYENDILLVGDDPWEEFVNCVSCIKILSPSEVQQMRQDVMQLFNTSSFNLNLKDSNLCG